MSSTLGASYRKGFALSVRALQAQSQHSGWLLLGAAAPLMALNPLHQGSAPIHSSGQHKFLCTRPHLLRFTVTRSGTLGSQCPQRSCGRHNPSTSRQNSCRGHHTSCSASLPLECRSWRSKCSVLHCFHCAAPHLPMRPNPRVSKSPLSLSSAFGSRLSHPSAPLAVFPTGEMNSACSSPKLSAPQMSLPQACPF